MLFLKLLQHVHLPLLLARWLALLLLPLVIHHLLHHSPRLTIQVTQLRVLRHDLGDVDFRRGGYNMRPPFHLVGLVEVDADLFLRGI